MLHSDVEHSASTGVLYIVLLQANAAYMACLTNVLALKAIVQRLCMSANCNQAGQCHSGRPSMYTHTGTHAPPLRKQLGLHVHSTQALNTLCQHLAVCGGHGSSW